MGDLIGFDRFSGILQAAIYKSVLVLSIEASTNPHTCLQTPQWEIWTYGLALAVCGANKISEVDISLHLF